MIWVDYALVGIVLISLLIGAWRGFVREVLSLISWILAFVVALRFAGDFANWLAPWIQAAAVRSVFAHIILFLGVLLAGGLAGWLLSKLIHSAGLGGVDRMLGAGLGLIRGALIVVVLVMVAAHSVARKEPWWTRSITIAYAAPAAAELQALIPEPWLSAIAFAASEPPNSKAEH